MTTQELLREVLKDETLKEKYGITEEELSTVSFDTTSKYPIIEALKTVIQLKDIGTPDTQVFKNIKTNQFNIH